MHFLSAIAKTGMIVTACLLGTLFSANGQSHLQKQITLQVNRQPVARVLQQIAAQGNFYFSYNASLIAGDSLVSLSANRRPVRLILEDFFGTRLNFKESGQYLILLPGGPTEKHVVLTGTIQDVDTHEPIDYASVYSKTLLVSALSDEGGKFRLRVRERVLPLEITISKVGYGDTTLLVFPNSVTDLSLNLTPKSIELDEVTVTNRSGGYRNFLANFLVSTRQRMNSLNIGRFFVSFPYQMSLTPGLGTHGRMASQVVNKVSINLIGGYTAGTKGVEIAGGFNISKKDVRYFQAAGIFNLVWGTVTGLQAAGVYNNAVDTLRGVQAAGFSNMSAGPVRGVQAAGIMNNAINTLRGVQAAGTGNLLLNKSKGAQLAGVFNWAGGDFSGIQGAGTFNFSKGALTGAQLAGAFNWAAADFSGIQASPALNHVNGVMRGLQLAAFNSASHLKGVQVGFINRADHSEGVSFGFLNFIRNGRSHFSVFHSDIFPYNLSWKTGTRRFYSMWTVGASPAAGRRRLGFGLGFGTDFRLSQRVGLQTEIQQLSVYTGNIDSLSNLVRLQVPFNVYLNKSFTLFAGPALSFQHTPGSPAKRDYQAMPSPELRPLVLDHRRRLWLGWQAGISWFYGRSVFH